MRVLFVNDYGFKLGGAEISALAQAEGLAKEGVKVRWFTSDSRGGGTLSTISADSEPFHRDYFCRGTSSDRRLLRALRQFANFEARRVLEAAIRDWKPDVIHLHGYLGQLSPAILRERNIPTLATLHNYRAICPKGTKHFRDESTCTQTYGRDCLSSGCLPRPHALHELLKRKWFGGPFHGIHRLIAPSHFVKCLFENETDLPIDVVPHSILRRSTLESEVRHPRHFLYVGRLHFQKGVDTLLEAFAQANVDGAKLFIIGDGPAKSSLEKLARRLGIDGRTVFLGYLDSHAVDRYYRRCQTVVVPSRWPETSGLVIGEALAAGANVIASRIGALAEWKCELISPNDVGAWATALQQSAEPRVRAASEIFDEGIARLLQSYRRVVDQMKKEENGEEHFSAVPTFHVRSAI